VTEWFGGVEDSVASEWRMEGCWIGSRLPRRQFIDWLTIRNQEESVLTDVERIESYRMVPPARHFDAFTRSDGNASVWQALGVRGSTTETVNL
jgi:hypothetical protein